MVKLPIHPNDVFTLNSYIGDALWQVQAFEDTLAHYLTMVLRMPKKVALKEAEQILDNVRGGTLGRLINELKKSIKIDPSLEDRLNHFLRERNWLVHKSRRLHHADIYHQNKFIKLLKRLEHLSEKAISLNRLFAEMLEKWVIAKGIPKERIDKYAKQIIESWLES